MVFSILGPLLVFSRKLEAAKREGLREYSMLAQRYVREFDGKWLRGGAPTDEPLVGTADIQSLADLGNSFEVVRGMRWVPFTAQTALRLAVATLLPVVPLHADDVLAAGIARAVARDCPLSSEGHGSSSTRNLPLRACSQSRAATHNNRRRDSEKQMTSSVTHFEIYAEEPARLAAFYRALFGWKIDKAPGIDYWRIDTGSESPRASAEG